MKRIYRAMAWVLAAVLLLTATPPGSVAALADGAVEVPKLQVGVLYENRTDDGRIDARVTISLDPGRGAYAPEGIEGLYVQSNAVTACPATGTR